MFAVHYSQALFIVEVSHGLEKDISSCMPMEGIARKKNSHGVWQERYFILNNSNIFYKVNKAAKEIKGTINLKHVKSVKAVAKGFELSIHQPAAPAAAGSSLFSGTYLS